MEQAYAEATAKQSKSIATAIIKVMLVITVVLVMLSTLLMAWLAILGVAAAALVIWYWPRFDIMWEYIYCDGQLDFDQIFGGEKRKNYLRIEIEDADVVAPIDSARLDGYRHLPVKDCSSRNEDASVYVIVTSLPGRDAKTMLLFEPSEKMLGMMHAKCPNIVEKPVR